MRGSEPFTGVSVEVLVKQQMFSGIGAMVKPVVRAGEVAASLAIREKNAASLGSISSSAPHMYVNLKKASSPSPQPDRKVSHAWGPPDSYQPALALKLGSQPTSRFALFNKTSMRNIPVAPRC